MTYKNIILISIDALRYDCSGYINSNEIPQNLLDNYLKIPNIKSIANNGACFTKAVASAPYTTTSHASIFTGKNPTQHTLQEMYVEGKTIKKNIPTLAESLKTLGYKTFMMTSMLDMFKAQGLTKGFDSQIKNDIDAIPLLRKINPGKNNFIFLHFYDVHTPYMYSESDVFVNNSDYYDEMQKISKKEKINYKSKFWNRRPLQIWYELNNFIKNDRQKLIPLYLKGVSKFDQTRFKLYLEIIKPLLERDDSLLVLLSDHGEGACNLESPQAFGHSMHMEQEVIRVPLIIKSNQIKKQTIDTPISLMDIKEIILKLATQKQNSNQLLLEGIKKYQFAESWNHNLQAADRIKAGSKQEDYYLYERVLIHKKYKTTVNYTPEILIKSVFFKQLTRKNIKSIVETSFHYKWPSKLVRLGIYLLNYMPFAERVLLKFLLSRVNYNHIKLSQLDENFNEINSKSIFEIKEESEKKIIINSLYKIFRESGNHLSKNIINKFITYVQ